MDGRTLYTELGRRAGQPTVGDHGRTEQTAARETIDNDRAHSTLYAAIGGCAEGVSDRARTEVTKVDAETVDRDRHMRTGFSPILGAEPDLYTALGSGAAAGGDPGRTDITESTETLDWERPPIGPRT